MHASSYPSPCVGLNSDNDSTFVTQPMVDFCRVNALSFIPDRLAAMFPEVYAGKGQLRTLQRRVKVWRGERAKELIFGVLKHADSQTDASGRAEEIQ